MRVEYTDPFVVRVRQAGDGNEWGSTTLSSQAERVCLRQALYEALGPYGARAAH